MKRIVTWAIDNSPAMNILMVGALLVGFLSLTVMRREVFPEFDLEIVLVTVPYPGASPDEVEEAICQKIEEAVQSIDGIKKMTSVANESAGSVVLEIRADVRDVQKIVNDVRSEVDRIPSFPDLAEDAKVQQITMRHPAIKLAVQAPTAAVDPRDLRAVAESVRDDLLAIDGISQVNLSNVPQYQIDVEISEATLRKYGLTLQDVAQRLRRENLEIPGGKIKSQGQEILLRGKNKFLLGKGIADLPLLKDERGVVLRVGDLGTVHDMFADSASMNYVNGKPAAVISIDSTSSEDLLAMTDAVNRYIESTSLDAGFSLVSWADRSIEVRDRLTMLQENGLMGLCLVFLVLALFLEIRLAFWVAMGIPIALLGSGTILLLSDQTLNMLSMFSFLMALGIVVDDAIVIGENIYAHREMGKPTVQAAIDGTAEVMPSVAASVSTTIIAFSPLLFVSGVMGKFIAVMPLAVIAMLLISLWESIFVLPCHLAHQDSLLFAILRFFLYPLRVLMRGLRWLNQHASSGLEWFIHQLYGPSLDWSVRNPVTVTAACVALLLTSLGFVQAGIVPFVIFPKIDGNNIQARVTFPDGTPQHLTASAVQRIEDALNVVNARYKEQGGPVVRTIYRSVGKGGGGNRANGDTTGSHVGAVEVQLTDTSERDVHSQTIVNAWRAQTGEIPGVENASFGTQSFGPGGTPIEFKLLASSEHVIALERAVEMAKKELAKFDGVFDIDDDSRPGKLEAQTRIKPRAQSLGVSNADLAETLRASYYGAEVMRLQRGRHEVKLMVRYPPEERRSLAGLHDLKVRTNDGAMRPIHELADIQLKRGYSEINRIDQKRSITVSADVDETRANAYNIVTELRSDFASKLRQEFPDVSVRWEGQQEQTQESVGSLIRGTGVALLAMYVLLVFEFRSYVQPILIMLIIPFGIIGAILGHALLGLQLTLFSFFGLVALTGVVVNDSIVLVDFINHRVRAGMPLTEALSEAGRRRFRPVLLTSITTIAGLLPILMETSLQAQILIPMATSLSFGLLLATILVLLLLPALYRIYGTLAPAPSAGTESEEVLPATVSEELAIGATP